MLSIQWAHVTFHRMSSGSALSGPECKLDCHSDHAADYKDCAHLASDGSPITCFCFRFWWSPLLSVVPGLTGTFYYELWPTESSTTGLLSDAMLPLHQHIPHCTGRPCLLHATMWSGFGQPELSQGLTSFFSHSIIWSEGPQCCPRCDLSETHKCNSDKWPGGLGYPLLCLPALLMLDPAWTIPSDNGSLLSPPNLTTLGFWCKPISEGWYWNILVVLWDTVLTCSRFRGGTLLERTGSVPSSAYDEWVNSIWGTVFISLFYQKSKLYFSQQLYQLEKKRGGCLLIFMPPTLTSITQSVSVLNPGKEVWLVFIGPFLKFQHSHQ